MTPLETTLYSESFFKSALYLVLSLVEGLHCGEETILLDDEEEERDILEELAGEEADDVSEIIWHEVHANAVRTAFDRLTPDEKEYLQRRNALCMKCGCARNIKYGDSCVLFRFWVSSILTECAAIPQRRDDLRGLGDSPQQAKSVQVLPEHCLRLLCFIVDTSFIRFDLEKQI